MKYSSVIKYYGSAKELELRFGFSRQRVSTWKKLGVVPPGPAYEMHVDSGGFLKMVKAKK